MRGLIVFNRKLRFADVRGDCARQCMDKCAWTGQDGAEWRSGQVQDGLWGTMEMRKTCRWLGCAALLCFTAVELSGCTSKPLISGMKWPGRQDRDSAFALTDTNLTAKKLTAEESEDLLTQAREFEQDGDYPQAARTYREYFSGGGQPISPSRRVPSQQVGKSDPKSATQKLTAKESAKLLAQAREYDQAGDFPKATRAYREYLHGGEPVDAKRKTPAPQVAKSQPKSRHETTEVGAEPPVRQTSKTKPPVPAKPEIARQVDVTDDPWADEPIGQPKSKSHPVIQPGSTASRSPQPNVAGEPATDDESIASDNDRQPPQGVSEEEIEELLDLDEGEINWGDDLEETQTASAEESLSSPAETVEIAESEFEAGLDLPLVDLSLDDSEEMSPPDVAEDSAPESEAVDEAWHIHEATEEPTGELAIVEQDEIPLPAEEEFSPPVMSNTDEASDVVEPESVEPISVASDSPDVPSLSSPDCEPWVYAQVMKLGSPDAEVRKEGLTHLADMGSTGRQASLAVRVLLEDPDPLVQAHAAWALWVIENDPWDSVATLRPLLDQSNPDVVELACYMLGDIGVQAESATDALELLRDHADGTTCIHAAEALIRIHGVDDKSLAILTNAVKSRDSEERWIAAVALGRCRGTKSAGAVAALTVALKDVDPEVRSAAALSLGGLGPDSLTAKPELERVARMDDPQVRDAARAALACLKR